MPELCCSLFVFANLVYQVSNKPMFGSNLVKQLSHIYLCEPTSRATSIRHISGSISMLMLPCYAQPHTRTCAVRVSSRHFFWHTLAWSRGDTPKLVFKDGAGKRPTYVLHSNRPTYAGEPIVDPARVEWSAIRETRLRPRRAR